MELEITLLKTITEKRVYKKSFADLVVNFEKKLLMFNPVEKAVKIEKYFLPGGIVSVTKRLLADNVIPQDCLREYKTKNNNLKNDFKGLYIFVHDKTPIYAGISKAVIGRILQHIKRYDHYASTLAYSIGLVQYEILEKTKYSGSRKDFDFKKYVTSAQEFLHKQKIAFLPILNDEELYLFEIYCEMQLQCSFNKFEIHLVLVKSLDIMSKRKPFLPIQL